MLHVFGIKWDRKKMEERKEKGKDNEIFQMVLYRHQ